MPVIDIIGAGHLGGDGVAARQGDRVIDVGGTGLAGILVVPVPPGGFPGVRVDIVAVWPPPEHAALVGGFARLRLVGPDARGFGVHGAALAGEAGLHHAAVHPRGNAAEFQGIGIGAGDVEPGDAVGRLVGRSADAAVARGDDPGDGGGVGRVGDKGAGTAVGHGLARRTLGDAHTIENSRVVKSSAAGQRRALGRRGNGRNRDCRRVAARGGCRVLRPARVNGDSCAAVWAEIAVRGDWLPALSAEQRLAVGKGRDAQGQCKQQDKKQTQNALQNDPTFQKQNKSHKISLHNDTNLIL